MGRYYYGKGRAPPDVVAGGWTFFMSMEKLNLKLVKARKKRSQHHVQDKGGRAARSGGGGGDDGGCDRDGDVGCNGQRCGRGDEDGSRRRNG